MQKENRVITSADVEFSAQNQVIFKKKKRSSFDSDFVIFILLSRESDRATEALCVERIQTRLGVAHVSEVSA